MGTGRLALVILSFCCVAVQGKLEIINGNDAAEYEFPFMVRLLNYGRHNCGASLIRPNIALTAAHCVESDVERYSVVVGDHIGSETGEFEREIRVERIISHEGYGGYLPTNDISLLVLEEEVELREGFIETIPIARNDLYYKEGAIVTLSGWGSNQYGEIPDVLQKLEYRVANQKVCQKFWEEKYGMDLSYIFENQVCIIDPERESSAYYGDSGGPLFVKNEGKFTQIGLVSWGQHYSEGISYNMFTDTHYFLDWVEEKIGESENKTVSDYIEIVEIKPKMKKISGTEYKKGKVNCKVEQLSPDIDMESQVLVGLFSVVDDKVNYLDAMEYKKKWSEPELNIFHYTGDFWQKHKITRDSCFMCVAVLLGESIEELYTYAFTDTCDLPQGEMMRELGNPLFIGQIKPGEDGSEPSTEMMVTTDSGMPMKRV